MHILAGFFQAALGASSVYAQVPGAVDQALVKSANNNYILPAKWRVLRAWANSVNLAAAQISAPSLRNLVLPEIYPVNVAATVPSRPPVCDYFGYGPFIQQNEELGVNASITAAGAADTWAGLWLADRLTPAPGGPATAVPFTATITAVKGSWVLGPITLSSVLPAGKYAVIGMSCQAANTLFARLVFPGMSQWRPGVLVDSAYGNFSMFPSFRNGAMGLFGEFVQTAQPQLEIFGLAAGAAAPAGQLDLIKIG